MELLSSGEASNFSASVAFRSFGSNSAVPEEFLNCAVQ